MKYEPERQDVGAAPAPDMRARGRRVQEPTPPMSGGARVQEGCVARQGFLTGRRKFKGEPIAACQLVAQLRMLG